LLDYKHHSLTLNDHFQEPLIPFSSFKEFHTAAVNKDEAQLKYAIETLPIPNRDTLAFMCAHWQKVAMRSNENQVYQCSSP
jgi:hypothetical protein